MIRLRDRHRSAWQEPPLLQSLLHWFLLRTALSKALAQEYCFYPLLLGNLVSNDSESFLDKTALGEQPFLSKAKRAVKLLTWRQERAEGTPQLAFGGVRADAVHTQEGLCARPQRQTGPDHSPAYGSLRGYPRLQDSVGLRPC